MLLWNPSCIKNPINHTSFQVGNSFPNFIDKEPKVQKGLTCLRHTAIMFCNQDANIGLLMTYEPPLPKPLPPSHWVISHSTLILVEGIKAQWCFQERDGHCQVQLPPQTPLFTASAFNTKLGCLVPSDTAPEHHLHGPSRLLDSPAGLFLPRSIPRHGGSSWRGPDHPLH